MPISILPSSFIVNPQVFTDSRGKSLIDETTKHPEPVGEYDRWAAEQAVKYLARQCDGAVSDDGVGFNKSDTIWGHEVASALQHSNCKLSDSQTRYILRRLRKYLNQLPVDLRESFNH